jgi:hypothetical protein
MNDRWDGRGRETRAAPRDATSPFSSYRAGFEVRTYRRCQRVFVFHHFDDEPAVGKDCLVRSTDLVYSDQASPTDPRNPIYTFLQSVTQTGYRRSGSSYVRRSLPPLELEYSEPRIQPDVLALDAESLAGLPEGLDAARYQWMAPWIPAIPVKMVPFEAGDDTQMSYPLTRGFGTPDWVSIMLVPFVQSRHLLANVDLWEINALVEADNGTR